MIFQDTPGEGIRVVRPSFPVYLYSIPEPEQVLGCIHASPVLEQRPELGLDSLGDVGELIAAYPMPAFTQRAPPPCILGTLGLGNHHFSVWFHI